MNAARSGGIFLRGARPVAFAPRTGTAAAEPLDVHVGPDGTVASVSPSTPGADAAAPAGATVIDARGSYLSPGWVDLHTHVYQAVRAGIDPQLIGPRAGVSLVIDAGSAGESTFDGFRAYVLERTPWVKAFLNVGGAGIAPYSASSIDLLRSSECVESNRRFIRGVKVLGSRKFIGDQWVHPVVAAKRLARDMGLPLMVHVAEPPVYIEELVRGILTAGDIITHCFHGKVGNSLRTSAARIVPLFREALERGILLDVGHGAASFSVEAARRAVGEGLLPSTISTDLHSGSYGGPVWSLACTASKMVACGMRVEDVVERVSRAPARAVGEERHGELAPGSPAAFTVFELLDGEFEFLDAGAVDDVTSGSDPRYQKRFQGRVFLRPRWTILAGSATAVGEHGLPAGRGA
jgi:dihydroorotase